MASYQIDLSRDFEAEVQKLANEQGIPKCQIILRALVTYVVQMKNKKQEEADAIAKQEEGLKQEAAAPVTPKKPNSADAFVYTCGPVSGGVLMGHAFGGIIGSVILGVIGLLAGLSMCGWTGKPGGIK